MCTSTVFFRLQLKKIFVADIVSTDQLSLVFSSLICEYSMTGCSVFIEWREKWERSILSFHHVPPFHFEMITFWGCAWFLWGCSLSIVHRNWIGDLWETLILNTICNLCVLSPEQHPRVTSSLFIYSECVDERSCSEKRKKIVW